MKVIYSLLFIATMVIGINCIVLPEKYLNDENINLQDYFNQLIKENEYNNNQNEAELASSSPSSKAMTNTENNNNSGNMEKIKPAEYTAAPNEINDYGNENENSNNNEVNSLNKIKELINNLYEMSKNVDSNADNLVDKNNNDLNKNNNNIKNNINIIDDSTGPFGDDSNSGNMANNSQNNNNLETTDRNKEVIKEMKYLEDILNNVSNRLNQLENSLETDHDNKNSTEIASQDNTENEMDMEVDDPNFDFYNVKKTNDTNNTQNIINDITPSNFSDVPINNDEPDTSNSSDKTKNLINEMADENDKTNEQNEQNEQKAKEEDFDEYLKLLKDFLYSNKNPKINSSVNKNNEIVDNSNKGIVNDFTNNELNNTNSEKQDFETLYKDILGDIDVYNKNLLNDNKITSINTTNENNQDEFEEVALEESIKEKMTKLAAMATTQSQVTKIQSLIEMFEKKEYQFKAIQHLIEQKKNSKAKENNNGEEALDNNSVAKLLYEIATNTTNDQQVEEVKKLIEEIEISQKIKENKKGVNQNNVNTNTTEPVNTNNEMTDKQDSEYNIVIEKLNKIAANTTNQEQVEFVRNIIEVLEEKKKMNKGVKLLDINKVMIKEGDASEDINNSVNLDKNINLNDINGKTNTNESKDPSPTPESYDDLINFFYENTNTPKQPPTDPVNDTNNFKASLNMNSNEVDDSAEQNNSMNDKSTPKHDSNTFIIKKLYEIARNATNPSDVDKVKAVIEQLEGHEEKVNTDKDVSLDLNLNNNNNATERINEQINNNITNNQNNTINNSMNMKNDLNNTVDNSMNMNNNLNNNTIGDALDIESDNSINNTVEQLDIDNDEVKNLTEPQEMTNEKDFKYIENLISEISRNTSNDEQVEEVRKIIEQFEIYKKFMDSMNHTANETATDGIKETEAQTPTANKTEMDGIKETEAQAPTANETATDGIKETEAQAPTANETGTTQEPSNLDLNLNKEKNLYSVLTNIVNSANTEVKAEAVVNIIKQISEHNKLIEEKAAENLNEPNSLADGTRPEDDDKKNSIYSNKNAMAETNNKVNEIYSSEDAMLEADLKKETTNDKPLDDQQQQQQQKDEKENEKTTNGSAIYILGAFGVVAIAGLGYSGYRSKVNKYELPFSDTMDRLILKEDTKSNKWSSGGLSWKNKFHRNSSFNKSSQALNKEEEDPVSQSSQSSQSLPIWATATSLNKKRKDHTMRHGNESETDPEKLLDERLRDIESKEKKVVVTKSPSITIEIHQDDDNGNNNNNNNNNNNESIDKEKKQNSKKATCSTHRSRSTSRARTSKKGPRSQLKRDASLVRCRNYREKDEATPSTTPLIHSSTEEALNKQDVDTSFMDMDTSFIVVDLDDDGNDVPRKPNNESMVFNYSEGVNVGDVMTSTLTTTTPNYYNLSIDNNYGGGNGNDNSSGSSCNSPRLRMERTMDDGRDQLKTLRSMKRNSNCSSSSHPYKRSESIEKLLNNCYENYYYALERMNDNCNSNDKGNNHNSSHPGHYRSSSTTNICRSLSIDTKTWKIKGDQTEKDGKEGGVVEKKASKQTKTKPNDLPPIIYINCFKNSHKNEEKENVGGGKEEIEEEERGRGRKRERGKGKGKGKKGMEKEKSSKKNAPKPPKRSSSCCNLRERKDSFSLATTSSPISPKLDTEKDYLDCPYTPEIMEDFKRKLSEMN